MAEARPPMVNDPPPSGTGLRVPVQRRDRRRGQGAVVAVVALGGVVGACARYGAALLWPTAAGTFPWTTLGVNVLGCAVMGVFMVVISEVWAAHRLVRPFFGTGVLGGFTTFSTYAVDIQRLVAGGHPRVAVAYLALTPCTALAAVWGAAHLSRRVLHRQVVHRQVVHRRGIHRHVIRRRGIRRRVVKRRRR